MGFKIMSEEVGLGTQSRGSVLFLRWLWLVVCLVLCACASVPKDSQQQEHIFYPPEPEQPRIQFLGTYSSDKDVLPELSAFQRFILGEREIRSVVKPYGVAIHDGQLLICDVRLGVVEVFDLRNRTIDILGGERTGHLNKPINIAVDEDGTRYVADSTLGRLMVYGQNNKYVRAIGSPDLWEPTDAEIDGNYLYVTDRKNGQVVVVEKTSGEEVRRFASKGSGEGELYAPTNIAIDQQGQIYVADTGNFRVLKFDARGRQLEQIGTLGRMPGQFVRPKGVAVDREGRLYVVDAAFENIQIFDDQSRLLLFFGSPGNHPGGLNMPAKVVIDYDNVDIFADRVAPGYELEYLILVTSQFGLNKVNVYGFLKEGDGADDPR
jgi:sugar lactone lactonase YvrE